MITGITKLTLSHFRHTELTCLGLLLFLGIFVGALCWIYRRGSDRFYGQLEQLPLEGEKRS